jgi:CubicO group peptidase (beta-lactamase class C family)
LGITSEPIAEPLVKGSFDEFMTVYDSIPGVTWPVDPQGYAVVFVWLKLTPGHLMRFGQLYSGRRSLGGRAARPRRLVADSTRSHVDYAGPQLHYGYQWWTLDVGHHPAFAAIGRAGQLIEVIPELNAVVVTSSDFADYAIDLVSELD